MAKMVYKAQKYIEQDNENIQSLNLKTRKFMGIHKPKKNDKKRGGSYLTFLMQYLMSDFKPPGNQGNPPKEM